MFLRTRKLWLRIPISKPNWLRLAVFPFLSAIVATNWLAAATRDKPPLSWALRRDHVPIVFSALATGLAISFVVVPPIPSKRTGARLPIVPGEIVGFCCGLVNLPRLWCSIHGPASLSTFIALSNIYVFVVLKQRRTDDLSVRRCERINPQPSRKRFDDEHLRRRG